MLLTIILLSEPSRQGASGGATTQRVGSDVAENVDPNNDKKLPAGKGKASFGECRICRKMFAKDEPRKICDDCKSPICEDCASYTSDNATVSIDTPPTLSIRSSLDLEQGDHCL